MVVSFARERQMRVPGVVVALCLVPTLAVSQSLGEAARRQAKKRTTAAPAATKSYSDDDLPSKEAQPLTAEATPEPSAGDKAKASPAASEPPASDEAVRRQLDAEAERRHREEARWRDRCRHVQDNIERAQREYDAVCGPGKILSGG